MRSTFLFGAVAAATVVSVAAADIVSSPSPFSGSMIPAGGSSSLAGGVIFEHGSETG